MVLFSGAWVATAEDKVLAQAFAAVGDMVKAKKIDIKAKVFPVADISGAVKAVGSGELAVISL